MTMPPSHDANPQSLSDSRPTKSAVLPVSDKRPSGQERYRAITKAGIAGIVSNVVLTAIKAAVGFAAGSMAIVLDALNSLTDVFSSAVTIIGVRIARMRPSRKHPYGFGRIEYVASVIIAATIIVAGILSLQQAISKIIHPTEPDYTLTTCAVLIIAILVKIWLSWYFMRAGKRLASQPLHASGIDALYDVILTSGTLIAAVICLLWNIDIDGWMAAIISLFVVKAGIDVAKSAFASIIGERPDEECVDRIRMLIAEHEGVMGVYDLMIDTFGPESTWAAAHIEVRDDMTAAEIHELTRHITEDLDRECNTKAILGIYASNCTGAFASIHRKLNDLVDHHPEILQVHGFYVDVEVQKIDFDLVIEFGHDADEIRQHIVSEMEELYPGYTFNVITDVDYVG